MNRKWAPELVAMLACWRIFIWLPIWVFSQRWSIQARAPSIRPQMVNTNCPLITSIFHCNFNTCLPEASEFKLDLKLVFSHQLRTNEMVLKQDFSHQMILNQLIFHGAQGLVTSPIPG